MKKAAILIDAYKLPVFEDDLTKAGFTYTVCNGVTSDTLLISVETETIAKLQPVVERANKRARDEKAQLISDNE
jgi:hypothetical protein